MQLPALMASPIAWPSMPRAVALLQAELARPEPALRRIAQVVRTDPAFTMRLLRAANSPAFGLSGRIGSPSEALAVVGMADLRALAQQAEQAAGLHGAGGVALLPFWRYSVQVAQYARSLAGAVRQDQGAAYTCGLIHAMGELAMYQALPQEMADIDAGTGLFDLLRARAEQRRLGFTYAQVAAGLARQDRYPEAMVAALEHQTEPFANDAYEPLAAVIHLAVWRARAQRAGLDEAALADTFPAAVADILGLDIDRVLQQDPFDWFARD